MILRKKENKMKTERELFQKAYEKTDHYYINYEKTNASNSAFSWNGQENRYTWHDVNSAWEMWCASAQREGYKLVPVEATDEMRMAAYTRDGDLVGDTSDIYKAMIGAVE